MTWTDEPMFKLNDDESYGNIDLLIHQWAERMTRQWTSATLYDQKEDKEVTWIEALSEAQYPGKVWMENIPIFSAADVEVAIEWELRQTRFTWHDRKDRRKLPTWPTRYCLPRLFRQPQCKHSDHKWSVDIIEGNLNLNCDDPCPEPIIRWVSDGSQQWPACLNLPDYECVSGTFSVKLETWNEWGDWGVNISPVFDSKMCCATCGCELVPPHVALSRKDNTSKLCPQCGADEAQGDLFEYIKEQNDGCQDEG